MNYTEDTAKRYKDELMRIYRSNNPQRTTSQQPLRSSASSTGAVPSPPAVLPPPETKSEAVKPAMPQTGQSDERTDNDYPFLLPQRNQSGAAPVKKTSAAEKKLEYTDYAPDGSEKFAAPPVKTQNGKRRSPAPVKKNGAAVRNVNGNASNSYNGSLAEARSKPAEDTMQNPGTQRMNTEEQSGSQSGLLMVEVSTAGGAVPLEGAFVTVTRRTDSGVSLVSMLTSDISGRTRTIELPAPDRSQSLSPEGNGRGKPFSSYTIRADKEGFYSVINVDVPVFSGVKSIQPVEMIPLPEYTPVPSPIEYVNEEPAL